MFTGIIESVGEITSLNVKKGDCEIKIKYKSSCLNDVSLGDSVSVNGICLTVKKVNKSFIYFDLSNETISRISEFKEGETVNLESSLRINGKVSGHFVFGHIDGIAKLIKNDIKSRSEEWTVKPPKRLMKYISEKGSITINGVSLTINSVQESSFKINLIPYTLNHTTLKNFDIGNKMNIEIDMLARYVETILKKS
ncbi:riboflavin synthase [Methylophilaceae bacterium]|jgi:riboflavin synthase|nr:riboflavin synthase [Methylophilaceae bacterium]|tara:strand:- start:585 stop:1172 length:588 start_codon:yes stop_codon:yes gene_type:complete